MLQLVQAGLGGGIRPHCRAWARGRVAVRDQGARLHLRARRMGRLQSLLWRKLGRAWPSLRGSSHRHLPMRTPGALQLSHSS